MYYFNFNFNFCYSFRKNNMYSNFLGGKMDKRDDNNDIINIGFGYQQEEKRNLPNQDNDKEKK